MVIIFEIIFCMVFNCTFMQQAVTTISAHDSPLAAMKFNADGSKLATASEKGTVIRVFGCPSGDRLFEFRRGMKRCVTIYSLAFSLDSMYLAAASNTETVHVFKLDHDKDARSDWVWGRKAKGSPIIFTFDNTRILASWEKKVACDWCGSCYLNPLWVKTRLIMTFNLTVVIY